MRIKKDLDLSPGLNSGGIIWSDGDKKALMNVGVVGLATRLFCIRICKQKAYGCRGALTPTRQFRHEISQRFRQETL
jgi:hypothetical protein